MRNPISAFLLRYSERLRFPTLFLLTTLLFVVDLLIPDAIPLVDELLLGMASLLFASLRKRRRLPEGDGDDPQRE